MSYINDTQNNKTNNSIKSLAATGLISIWLSGCSTMANKDFEEYNACPDLEKFHQNLDKLDKPLLAPVQMLYAGGGMACYMTQELVRLPIIIGGVTECGIRNLFSGNSTPETASQPENTTNPNPTAKIESNLPEFCQSIK